MAGAVGWIAAIAPWALPRRVRTTPAVVVIRHPRPISPGHLLLLARNHAPGLDGDVNTTALALDTMLRLSGPLTREHFERPEDVIAVVNGGARQDVRLLHLHLISDGQLAAALWNAESDRLSTDGCQLGTSRPLQPVHFLYDRSVVGPAALVADVSRNASALRLGGYSLMVRAVDPTVVHLVGSSNRTAGGRLPATP